MAKLILWLFVKCGSAGAGFEHPAAAGDRMWGLLQVLFEGTKSCNGFPDFANFVLGTFTASSRRVFVLL